MSNATGSLNEWELSKENIQPLRQGRKFSSLTAALQPHDGNEWSKIKEEKQLFEEELRTYSGDDPLDVWYRYIVWTEQTYPKGGKDGDLSTLLEKCLKQFQTKDMYKNDKRYVSCWIKYANCCIDPQTIFIFMYDQNIGSEWAQFYESWAWHLEQLGNTQRANSILHEGISRNAEPLENLKRSFSEFQMRVARSMMSSEVSVDSACCEQLEAKRSALGHLKASRKHSHVPVDRAGALQTGSQGGIGIGGKPLVSQHRQQFQVFNDENQAPSNHLPPQTGEWQSVPHRSVINKENDQKPGVWTKARVPQKGGVVPFNAVNLHGQPSFSVLEEENPDPAIFTPRTFPDVGNPVLSARKPSKHADPLASVRQSGLGNPDQQPMYCKDKVYCGAEEYSFEELRAAKWRQKMKKEDDLKIIEDENREMENKRLELEHQKLLLSEQTEVLRLLREQLQLDQEVMMQEYAQQTSQIELERNGDSLTVKKSLFEGVCDNMSVTHLKDLEKVKLEQGPEAPTHVKYPNSSNKTPTLKDQPSSDCSRLPNGPTPENTQKINVGDSSPTVNTREAMNLVADMFFPLDRIDKQFGWDDEDNAEVAQAPVVQPGQSGPLQFVIFDEMQDHRQPEGIKMSSQVTNRMPLQQKLFSEPSVNDVEMPPPENSAQKQGHKMEEHDDDKMEGVESEARDDLTIAPVGSHLSFAAAAHVASTPFHSNHSTNKMNDQDIVIDNQTVVSQNSLTFSTSYQPAIFDNTDGSLSKKDLSPIMEGSNEECNSHGSSSSTGASHIGITCRSEVDQSVQSISERDVLPPSASEQQYVQPQNLFHSSQLLHPVKDTNLEANPATLVIDTTAFIATDGENELCIDIYDPFDEEMISQFLGTLPEPLSTYPNYIAVDGMMSHVGVSDIVSFGPDMFTIEKKVGKGGYAQVYSAQSLSFNDTLTEDLQALKVQKPASKWEFYICSELQERLCRLSSTIDMRPSMMKVNKGYFFSDSSCLVSNFCPNGSLLEFGNKVSLNNSVTDKEPLCAYLTIELLRIIEQLHKCRIIHGDIKPDNFLVLDLCQLEMTHDPDVVFGHSRSLQLIDFGQGIDMTKYPAGTTFMAKVKTAGFQCVEMMSNRPWTYQTDLFGLLGTVHVLVFNKYMKIYCSNGVWASTKAFPRKWNVDLWKELFNIILNIPSCEEIPDVSKLRQKFEDYFIANLIQRYNRLDFLGEASCV